MILAMGLVAFVFDTAGGVLFAKFLNIFRKHKINPMVGAAGISAFPMSGARHPEDGHRRRPEHLHHHAGRRCERLRPDRLGHGRRHRPRPGSRSVGGM